jgi:Zn-finger nucleic acid-binding protein
MKCPKCKDPLSESKLFVNLPSQVCGTCAGQWVDADNYQVWREDQARVTVDPNDLLQADLSGYQVPAELDTKTGLCPQCQKILSRTRVGTNPFFYLDYCQSCNGFWFDRDEPAILEKVHVHDQLEVLVTSTWQSRVRATQLVNSEKQAIIDKLGAELAQQVFDFAEVLKEHPNGDFAVAYFMRRFERESPNE